MACSHTHMIHVTEPSVLVCEDCLSRGDEWVHLRLCVTCGYVGCCDSSKNKHARKHYLRNEHPVIMSLESDDPWIYCFVDEEYLEKP